MSNVDCLALRHSKTNQAGYVVPDPNTNQHGLVVLITKEPYLPARQEYKNAGGDRF